MCLSVLVDAHVDVCVNRQVGNVIRMSSDVPAAPPATLVDDTVASTPFVGENGLDIVQRWPGMTQMVSVNVYGVKLRENNCKRQRAKTLNTGLLAEVSRDPCGCHTLCIP